jgi:hypothetical protein
MTDLTLTDVLRRMDRRIKDQRKPGIEDVKTWAEALYRIRARDDQAVRGFIDRDIQQRKEIERLREALGHLDAAAHVSRENQGGWLGAPFVEQIVRAALAKEEDK